MLLEIAICTNYTYLAKATRCMIRQPRPSAPERAQGMLRHANIQAALQRTRSKTTSLEQFSVIKISFHNLECTGSSAALQVLGACLVGARSGLSMLVQRRSLNWYSKADLLCTHTQLTYAHLLYTGR